MKNLEELKLKIAEFAIARDWDQFHSPKNLTMALSVEVAELVEHFQWLTSDETEKLSDEKREAVADEIADIQIYLIRLADKLNVDILDSVDRKLLKNEVKYPIDKVRGSAKKYSDYE